METIFNMPFFLLLYGVPIIVVNIPYSFVLCEKMFIISTVIVMF